MVTLYIIQGCRSCARTVGNEHVEQLSGSTLKMITALYVVSILLGMVMAFISSEEMKIVAGVLAIVISIVSIVAYVLFLKVLSQTKAIL